jgi:hypothetical protein
VEPYDVPKKLAERPLGIFSLLSFDIRYESTTQNCHFVFLTRQREIEEMRVYRACNQSKVSNRLRQSVCGQ